MTLACEAVAVAGVGRDRLAALDLSIAAGTLLAVIGPNGAGKSTLLRAILGLVPRSGRVMVGDRDVAAMSAGERARALAYLPQAGSVAWPVNVEAVVALGRHPHGDDLARPAGVAAVERALDACDLAALRRRRVDTLSGGEQARVLLARALAVEAPVLVADEPGAALDLAHRARVFEVLRRRADGGGIVLLAVHDLADVERWADRVLVLSNGRSVGEGPPSSVLTETLLADVFGVRAVGAGRFGPIWRGVAGA